jgi:hypothetical protein
LGLKNRLGLGQATLPDPELIKVLRIAFQIESLSTTE